jgi:hypothetical protein
METREKIRNVPAMDVIVAVPGKSTYPRKGHIFTFEARPCEGNA